MTENDTCPRCGQNLKVELHWPDSTESISIEDSVKIGVANGRISCGCRTRDGVEASMDFNFGNCRNDPQLFNYMLNLMKGKYIKLIKEAVL